MDCNTIIRYTADDGKRYLYNKNVRQEDHLCFAKIAERAL